MFLTEEKTNCLTIIHNRHAERNVFYVNINCRISLSQLLLQHPWRHGTFKKKTQIPARGLAKTGQR